MGRVPREVGRVVGREVGMVVGREAGIVPDERIEEINEVKAVVSRERVLKGRPLDAGIPLGRTGVENDVAACAVAMNESTRADVSFMVKMQVQQDY